MYEYTSRNVDSNDRNRNSLSILQPEPADRRIQGRIDGIIAYLVRPALNRIQTVQWNTHDISRRIIDTQHDDATRSVRHTRQLVAKAGAVRTGDAVSRQGDAFQLQSGVLAQLDAFGQVVGLHDCNTKGTRPSRRDVSTAAAGDAPTVASRTRDTTQHTPTGRTRRSTVSRRSSRRAGTPVVSWDRKP